MNFSDQFLCKKLWCGSFFMRFVKPEIHDIQERKKQTLLYAACKERKTKKLPFSLRIFTNIIAELVVDNALCEYIFAKCFQLLFN